MGTRTFDATATITSCRYVTNDRAVYVLGNTTIASSLFEDNNNAVDPVEDSVTISNCTFHGNDGAYRTSGLNSPPTGNFTNCTFTSNAIAFAVPGTTNVFTSIIAGNSAEDDGNTPTYTNWLRDTPTNAGLDTDVNGDAVLADNGGPWATVALLLGSPAIDAAGDTGLTTDQRGVTRPQGAADDVGAFELAGPDTQAPVVTVSAPTANQRILSSDWTQDLVNGTATDNVGVNSVDVKLFHTVGGTREFWDGTSFVPASTSTTATLSTPGGSSVTWEWEGPTAAQLGTGGFTVVVSSSDAVGNISTAATRNFSVVLEEQPPVITVLNPAALAKFTPADFAASSVNGTVTDNTAVATIQVKLHRVIGGTKEYWDGAQFSTAPANAPISTSGLSTASATWSLNSMPSAGDLTVGSYGVNVAATDSSGNLAVVTRPFTISTDSQIPVVTVDSPRANQRIKVSDFGPSTVTGKATDNVHVSSVTVKLYRNAGGVKTFWNGATFGSTSVSVSAQITGNPQNRTWTLTNVPSSDDLEPGNYSVQVGATDSSGNKSVLVTRNFVIEADPPAVARGPSGSQF